MQTELTKRTGMIARKLGMAQIFSETGESLAVTLLQADSNVVVGLKTSERDGYNAVVLGFDEAKPTRVSKSVRGICAKAGVSPVKHMKEFRVSADAMLKVGDKLALDHFMPNQRIDIQGISIGKGFAGAMKRHNFAGLEASHGVSISHRSHGSTGNRQDPGRTFPGKKMAGHLGTETVTIQSQIVASIDEELGIIAINGSVPGKKGSYVYIRDAVKTVLPYEVQIPASLVKKEKAEANAPQTSETKEAEAPEANNNQ